MQDGDVQKYLRSHSLLMRLLPPHSDEHTAAQCAEDHASQRAPLWRLWEKARQLLSVVDKSESVLDRTGTANFRGCRHATACTPLLHL